MKHAIEISEVQFIDLKDVNAKNPSLIRIMITGRVTTCPVICKLNNQSILVVIYPK